MPKYIYSCKECKIDFEIKHSLRETCINCENCGSKDSLERKPAGIFLVKKQSKLQLNSKAGNVVKEAIEEARSDLRQDQGNLKQRIYKK